MAIRSLSPWLQPNIIWKKLFGKELDRASIDAYDFIKQVSTLF